MVKIFSIDNGAFLNQIQRSEAQLNTFLSENWEYFFPQYIFIKSEYYLEGNARSNGSSGRIDILAFNPNENKFVVFELKRNLSRNIAHQAVDYRNYIKRNFPDIYHSCVDDIGVTLPAYKTINRDSIEIVLISNFFSVTDMEEMNNFKNDEITLIKYSWFENGLLFIEYLNNEPTIVQQTNKVEEKATFDHLRGEVPSQPTNRNHSPKQKMTTQSITGGKLYKIETNGYKAFLLATDKSFVILKDSKINEKVATTCPPNIRNLTEELKRERVIVDNKFTKDYLCSSYSAALSLIHQMSKSVENSGIREAQIDLKK